MLRQLFDVKSIEVVKPRLPPSTSLDYKVLGNKCFASGSSCWWRRVSLSESLRDIPTVFVAGGSSCRQQRTLIVRMPTIRPACNNMRSLFGYCRNGTIIPITAAKGTMRVHLTVVKFRNTRVHLQLLAIHSYLPHFITKT